MDPYKMAWICNSAEPKAFTVLYCPIFFWYIHAYYTICIQCCIYILLYNTVRYITQYTVLYNIHTYYCITLCVISHNIHYTVLCMHIIVQHCALYHTIYIAVYTYYCITLCVISHNIQCCIYTLCVMSLCTRPVLHVTRILLTMMMISADLIHCFYDIM